VRGLFRRKKGESWLILYGVRLTLSTKVTSWLPIFSRSIPPPPFAVALSPLSVSSNLPTFQPSNNQLTYFWTNVVRHPHFNKVNAFEWEESYLCSDENPRSMAPKTVRTVPEQRPECYSINYLNLHALGFIASSNH